MARVRIKHTSEGPRHDPYSVVTVTFTPTHGEEVIARIAEFTPSFTVAGKVTKCNDAIEVENLFERHVGFSVAQACRYEDRAKHTCPCGCRSTHVVHGYPGETFNVCDRCGRFVSSDFNESAII